MLDELRDAIVAAVDAPFVAAYPTLPIVYDNTPFDWNAPPPIFVEFEISFLAGHQVGMAAAPRSRIRGTIYVTATARAGLGSKALLKILDWFANQIKYTYVGGCHFQAPEPDGSHPGNGWFSEGLKIAFFTDPL